MKIVKTGLMILGLFSVAGISVSLINMAKISNLNNNENINVSVNDEVKTTNLSDLNIHFSQQSPEDTDMLWVKCDKAPDKLNYSNKADVNILDTLKTVEYTLPNYVSNAFINNYYYDHVNKLKVNLNDGSTASISKFSDDDLNCLGFYFNDNFYYSNNELGSVQSYNINDDSCKAFGKLVNDYGGYSYNALMVCDKKYMYTFGHEGAQKYLISNDNNEILFSKTLDNTNTKCLYNCKKGYIIDNYIIGHDSSDFYIINKTSLDILKHKKFNDDYGLYVVDSFVLYNNLYFVLLNGDVVRYDISNDKFININFNLGNFKNCKIFNDLATNDIYVYQNNSFRKLENKILLPNNECLLYYSNENENRFKLYKNDNINAQVCLPEAVYIGNDKGEAVKYECYIYNKVSLQWELV